MVSAMIAGCGSAGKDTEKSTNAQTEAETAAKEETEAAKTKEAAGKGDALNIAIVSSPSGVDDGSFNQDNYNGILAFIENT